MQLAFNGADNAVVFPDASIYAHVPSANGNARIRTDQSQWGGASLYCDGTGDFVSVPDSPAFHLAGGNFTIEAWIRPDSVSGGVFNTVAAQWVSGSATLCSFVFGISANRLYFAAGVGGSSSSVTGTSLALAAATWHHVAVTREGDTIKLWLDGVQDAATLTVSGILNDSTGALRLGVKNTTDLGYLTGYLDDFRLTRGVALYKATFTPPAAAFAAPPAADPFIQNRVLMLHMEGPDAGTTFVDASPNARTVTPSGNAQHTTTTPLVGTSSLLVDGTGDYLTVPTDQEFNFGTGDFTVEAYVRRTGAFPGDNFIVSSSGSGGMFFGFQTSTTIGIGRTTVAWDSSVTHSMVADTTYHVAVSRSGTSLRFFVDGVQVGSTLTNSQSYNLSTTSLTVASQGASLYYNGRLDEIRVTAGIARYTANFTPLAPFPDT